MTLALRICALSVAGGMRRCEGSSCFVVDSGVVVVVVDLTVDKFLVVSDISAANAVVDDNDNVVDETVSAFPIKSTSVELSLPPATAAVDTSSLFITKILQTTKNVNTTLEKCILILSAAFTLSNFVFEIFAILQLLIFF